VDDGSIAELRRLQLRAYAPDGDIQDDEAALRRLDELEHLRRAAALSPATDALDLSPAVDASPGGDEDLESPAAAPAESHAPARGHRRRWWALLWAASLIVVAAVVGATALSAAPRAPLAAGAHYVATLAEDPDFSWPTFLGDPQGDATGFRDFLGLTAVMVDGDLWGSRADKCLLLLTTEHVQPDTESYNGQIFSGCGAGAFPATVEMLVAADAPAPLFQRFPEGTALQFVLDGSRVDVYADSE
jgi:hypothetical protein